MTNLGKFSVSTALVETLMAQTASLDELTFQNRNDRVTVIRPTSKFEFLAEVIDYDAFLAIAAAARIQFLCDFHASRSMLRGSAQAIDRWRFSLTNMQGFAKIG